MLRLLSVPSLRYANVQEQSIMPIKAATREDVMSWGILCLFLVTLRKQFKNIVQLQKPDREHSASTNDFLNQCSNNRWTTVCHQYIMRVSADSECIFLCDCRLWMVS